MSSPIETPCLKTPPSSPRANSHPGPQAVVDTYTTPPKYDSPFLKSMRKVVEEHANLYNSNFKRSPCPVTTSSPPKSFRELRNISPSKINSPSLHKSPYHTREKVTQNFSFIAESETNTLSDYKSILRKMFQFYCTFGDRSCASSMKTNNLYKFAHDARLVNKTQVTQLSLDLLFRKHSQKSHGIDFDKFLLIVIELGVIKYPKLPEKDAFVSLFEESIKPLYCSLYQNTEVGEHDVISQENIEADALDLIEEVLPTISTLHKFLFPAEYHKTPLKVVRTKAEIAITAFLKEYDIIPCFLTYNKGQAIFNETLDTNNDYIEHNIVFKRALEKDQGLVFTIRRFILYLIRLGIIAHPATIPHEERIHLTQRDRIEMLFQKIEISPGFKKFKRSVASPSSTNLFLLPLRSIKKKLEPNRILARNGLATQNINLLEREERGRSNESKYQSQTVPQNEQFEARRGSDCNNYQSPYRSYTPEPHRGSSPYAYQSYEISYDSVGALETYSATLQNVFKAYSSVLGSGNKYVISTTGLTSLLRDANLYQDTHLNGPEYSTNGKGKLLNKNDFEILIQKVTTSSIPLSARLKKYKYFDGYDVEEEPSYNTQPRKRTITFDIFLKIIQHVAGVAYPHIAISEAIKLTVNDHLQPLIEQNNPEEASTKIKQQLMELVSMLKDPSLMDIFVTLKKKLSPFYKHYCGINEKCIKFSGFMNFCRDFAMFPNLITKVKLLELFHSLAELYPLLQDKPSLTKQIILLSAQTCQTGETQEDAAKLVLDENLFIKAILMCALEINQHESSTVTDKVMYMVANMIKEIKPKRHGTLFENAESMKNQKALQEINHYIKTKYYMPTMTVESFKTNRTKKFDDLFTEEH